MPRIQIIIGNEIQSGICLKKIQQKGSGRMDTIICIGDSLTYGYGVHRAQCWTKLAAEMSGWTIVNRGVCGDTTGGMLVRMREILREGIGEKNERCFLLMGGCNDILYSGSRGNCTLVRDGETEILIDCGKSLRALTRSLSALGTSPDRISAVFVTHEHSDHTSALDALTSKYKIPVHIETRCAPCLFRSENVAASAVCHDGDFTVRTGSRTVSSFPLPHDSASCVTERAVAELSVCRRVMVEANHDVEMLTGGPYPPVLKRRILSPRGHLSNEDCAALVCTLARSGVGAFALAHLSPENNIPGLAYGDVRAALDAEGFPDCALVVAERDLTVSLPELAKETQNA